MNKEEHREALRSFEVDRLLKLLAIEAKKHHDGHYTIFSFTTHYKVAFGTPTIASMRGRVELQCLRGFKTLKEAIINALVDDREFSSLAPYVSRCFRCGENVKDYNYWSGDSNLCKLCAKSLYDDDDE